MHHLVKLKNQDTITNLGQIIGAAYYSARQDAWSSEKIKKTYPFMIEQEEDQKPLHRNPPEVDIFEVPLLKEP